MWCAACVVLISEGWDFGMVDSRLADGGPERAVVRAAQYVRMSTEHQKYSTENQSLAIADYAAANGMEIVRTYADQGKSGLRIEGRSGLQRLLDDVASGSTDFSIVLVYDISRWGRFQDADESAFYEFSCKRAGIRVEYCAEGFENDGSIGSDIQKIVKRKMAGEYSRELSVKVFAGQSTLIGKGFRQGGPAGFGLRRHLIDEHGASKGELARREQKSIQTDRVILVPGPLEEVLVVRRIYQEFVENGLSEREIADLLNREGVRTDLGRPWTRGTVHQVLINEKYVGNNVWNRSSSTLKRRRVRNAPELWVRADGVFEAIVDEVAFEAAQAIITARSYRMSDQEMLGALRQLLGRHGYLSGMIINETEGCPSSTAFQSRFGSLLRTYSLIGYAPGRDYRYVEINRRLRLLHPQIVDEVVTCLRDNGSTVDIDPLTELLTINGEISASLVLSRCRVTSSGGHRWVFRFDTSLVADITIAVRLMPGEEVRKDYFLLPSVDLNRSRLRLADHNGAGLDTYRFDTLTPLYDLARRSRFKDIF